MNPNKKKIVFLLPAFSSGGAERVLITLLNNIDREQYTPHLISISKKGKMRDFVDKEIPVDCLDTARVSRSVFKLLPKLKEINPDIIVSTMMHMNFIALLLKPFFIKTKFILREANTISFILGDIPYKKNFLKLAYKTLYPWADLIISPTQIIIDEFKFDLKMKCKNHKLLHNPVDLSNIREAEAEEIEITSKRKNTVHFVASGRLNKQKGFDRLITILPNLEIPYDWKLTIWGDGAEHGNLQKLIKLHSLENKVTLAGHTKFPWPHYAAADCFLMPSRFEGLPNVVLESLACGTPVIATKSSGGISEIQEYAGEEHIKIANDMNAFIHMMSKVKPSPSKTFSKSLLPDHFSKEKVMIRFTKILQELG